LKRERLLGSGIVVLGNDDYRVRVRELIITLNALVIQYRPQDVIIEEPEVWKTPKGHRAATSGSLSMLTFAVGALWEWATHTVGAATLVPVTEWKGQLPKKIMLKRLQDRELCLGLRPTDKDMNESDAVGLLDWWMRR
jgi:hypothetical protein